MLRIAPSSGWLLVHCHCGRCHPLLYEAYHEAEVDAVVHGPWSICVRWGMMMLWRWLVAVNVNVVACGRWRRWLDHSRSRTRRTYLAPCVRYLAYLSVCCLPPNHKCHSSLPRLHWYINRLNNNETTTIINCWSSSFKQGNNLVMNDYFHARYARLCLHPTWHRNPRWIILQLRQQATTQPLRCSMT